MNNEMYKLGTRRSNIREMFEYGKKRKSEIGEDKVFDFSIGNPNVNPPKIVNDTLIKLIKETPQVTLHGYTSAQGNLGVRRAIANHLNKITTSKISEDKILMTCGAAASLSIILKGIVERGSDEIVLFAPYFPEYTVYISNTGAKKIVVDCANDFEINFDDLEKKVNMNTKAVIVNSPNNPSGKVYSENTLKKLADFLKEKEKEYGGSIYLISDEPYREIVYNGVTPMPSDYYFDTVICYSYSKSLSLAGERVGYIAIPESVNDCEKLFFASLGAARSLGYINCPSIFQQLIEKVEGNTSDIGEYKKNRDLLYNSLIKMGYKAVLPEGAFYLFLKCLENDEVAFSNRARDFELLLVPSTSFGMTGYVRVSYCVSNEQIKNSLPAFQKLHDSYNDLIF